MPPPAIHMVYPWGLWSRPSFPWEVGGGGLHPERQLERGDPAFERGVGAGMRTMVRIHLADQVELHTLEAPGGRVGAGDERDLGLIRGDARVADRRPLVHGGEEGR